MTVQCDSHEQLVSEMQRVYRNQSQLYDLDRERVAQLSAISVSVARVEEKQTSMSDKMEQMLSEFEAQSVSSNSTINKLLAVFEGGENRKLKRKWKPENTVALISALGGLSGLASVLIIFLGRLR
jgi:hypothetical protein